MFVPKSAGSGKVYARPAESMLLRTQPLDSTAKAELVRGGLDPVQFEQEFNTELGYRFSQRQQEEALDSASAEVVLTVQLKHLQPGVGTNGTFGVIWLQTNRGGKIQWTEWKWRKPAKENVPSIYLARHMARLAADEILRQVLPGRPRPKEPPPPLQLL